MTVKKLWALSCILILAAAAEIQAQPAILRWKFNTKAPLFASPAGNGTLVFFGSTDSVFYAVNSSNGKEAWRFRTGGAIRSTALLQNQFLYFISGDGFLYCLDTAGSLQWKFQGGETTYDFADYHQSSPVMSNGRLFAGMGNGNLYAIDPVNGKGCWTFKTGGPIHGTPACDDSTIYFGSFDGNVYAVDLNDGTQRWKFKTVGHAYFPKGEVQGSPAMVNNSIVIGARDYNVYAIDKKKGVASWNKVFTRGWVLSNTIHDSTLYLAGADERILAAFDVNTMKEKWKRNMELLMFGHPAFEGTTLYIGTTIGKLHAVDAITGKDKWVYNTDAYTNNHLRYFKPDDIYRDDIYSIIKSNEQFLEAQVELGGIFSTPLVEKLQVFFTSTDGSLYCLSTGD